MDNEEQERRIRRTNCGRIEDNIQRYKRLLREFWHKRNELDTRIQSLKTDLSNKESELQMIETEIALASGVPGRAGAVFGLVNAVALSRRKGAVEDKISRLKSEIQKAERELSSIQGQIDDYEYNFELSRNRFQNDKCWELNFSSDNLNRP